MATTTTTNTKISLKLLIDTNSNKVLFAEARKDFVDLLFGLLELPLGTILAFLTKLDDTAATYGSLSKVYQSVQNLDNDYLQPNQTKDTLLRPKIGASNTAQTPLLKQFLAMADPPNQTKVIHSSLFGNAPSVGFGSAPSFSSVPSFGFSSAQSLFGSTSPSFSSACAPSFSSAPSLFGSTCPTSFSSACAPSVSSAPSLFGIAGAPSFSSASVTSNVHDHMTRRSRRGAKRIRYVKGVVTYMVMDDLMVKPMSSISSIALLKNLKVDINCIHEKTVTVDMDEVLELLMKVFSKSTTVLTDVFLPQSSQMCSSQ
ncbi:hypothetical protein LOK49_LG15G01418 [Camellia lanceoleosa]|uniref:Uncharacterized protein n=1 Tax=Camellia lanceoleosa TaxID=1840588 RepID=A0ACC0F8S9_9ERIC|nr:hypothetical protein LOK49_LG15G01418 [Camellia lanceoleosa]